MTFNQWKRLFVCSGGQMKRPAGSPRNPQKKDAKSSVCVLSWCHYTYRLSYCRCTNIHMYAFRIHITECIIFILSVLINIGYILFAQHLIFDGFFLLVFCWILFYIFWMYIFKSILVYFILIFYFILHIMIFLYFSMMSQGLSNRVHLLVISFTPMMFY